MAGAKALGWYTVLLKRNEQSFQNDTSYRDCADFLISDLYMLPHIIQLLKEGTNS